MYLGRDRKGGPWWVFAALTLGILLSAINASAISVALPTVVRHFGASPSAASWVLAAYLLANTVMILVFGRLADVFGRVRLYRAGLWTLTGASLLCGFAPTVYVLIAFQFAQGIGAAAVVSSIVAILADNFPPSRLGVALGWSTAAVSLSQVLGPVLGGALVHAFDWRMVFWFNVPVGALGLMLGYGVLVERGERSASERFDLIGAASYAMALGGLVLVLIGVGPRGLSHPSVLSGLALLAVGLPLFAASQARGPAPIVPRGVFDDRLRNAAFMAAFLVSSCRTAVVLLTAVFVQAATDAGPLEAGLQVFPLALGMALGAAASGAWRWSELNRIAALGALVSAVAVAALASQLSVETPHLVIAGCLLVVGVGLGTFQGPNTTLIMQRGSPSQRGVVNGVRSTVQNMSLVISSAGVLASMVVGLNPSEKAATYAGTVGSLSSSALGHVVMNCRVTLLGLAGLALAAAAISWFGGGREAEPDGSMYS